MRRATSFLLVSVVALLVSGWVGYVAQSQPLQSLSLTPFVAQGRLQDFAVNGKTPGPREYLIAHRADGSYVLSFSVPSPTGEFANSVHILDLPAQKSISLEPFTQSSRTYYLSAEEARKRVKQRRGCDDASIQEQINTRRTASRMLNHDVVRITRKTLTATVSAWVVPALDCLAVDETESFSSGAHNVRWLENIQAGPPPQSLFEIPPGYVERSPTMIEALYEAKYPGHKIFTASQLKVIERNYATHRQP